MSSWLTRRTSPVSLTLQRNTLAGWLACPLQEAILQLRQGSIAGSSNPTCRLRQEGANPCSHCHDETSSVQVLLFQPLGIKHAGARPAPPLKSDASRMIDRNQCRTVWEPFLGKTCTDYNPNQATLTHLKIPISRVEPAVLIIWKVWWRSPPRGESIHMFQHPRTQAGSHTRWRYSTKEFSRYFPALNRSLTPEISGDIMALDRVDIRKSGLIWLYPARIAGRDWPSISPQARPEAFWSAGPTPSTDIKNRSPLEIVRYLKSRADPLGLHLPQVTRLPSACLVRWIEVTSTVSWVYFPQGQGYHLCNFDSPTKEDQAPQLGSALNTQN